MKTICLFLLGCGLFLPADLRAAPALKPIPDKLVVLTFDDSVASQYSVARPLLKKYKFGATFFISEGFSFLTDKTNYMTWRQISELHQDGFEIGNHTRDHASVKDLKPAAFREQLEAINNHCQENGIPRPVSFAYPGNAISTNAFQVLKELGFKFARRGGAPEFPYEGGKGHAFEPGQDHPLLIPSAGDARPNWTLDNFRQAVAQARDGKIAVIQFHGVPDHEHPWVHTAPEKFQAYMDYLQTNHFKVIALRDLENYVDPSVQPADAMRIIELRQERQKAP